MMLLNLAAVVVAVAMIVLVIVLVPLIMEMRRTATTLREFIERTEAELTPTIKELKVTLADLQVLTSGAAEKVEDVQCFMAAVGETGRGIRTISTIVSGAAGVLSNSTLWLTGAKVAGSYMMDKLIKKRG